MTRPSWIVLVLAGCLGASGAAEASWPLGCWLHPAAPPRPEVVAACLEVPCDHRDHVHIFVVNGVDPANICNLRGLYDYLRALGFRSVHFGQLWDAHCFATEIRRLRCADPRARIVLLGFSAGANIAWRMAQSLNADGVQLDLLVYLGGDMLRNCRGARPENACRVLNIRAWGLVFLAGGLINGADIDGCENHHFGFIRHSRLPAHQPMLELLAHELTLVARSVP
jgi:hypothetical protein